MPSKLFISSGILTDNFHSHLTPWHWEASSFYHVFSVKWEESINCPHLHACSPLTQTNMDNNLAITPQHMLGPILKSIFSWPWTTLLSLKFSCLLPNVCGLHQHSVLYALKLGRLKKTQQQVSFILCYTLLLISTRRIKVTTDLRAFSQEWKNCRSAKGLICNYLFSSDNEPCQQPRGIPVSKTRNIKLEHNNPSKDRVFRSSRKNTVK